jgi:ribosomal protein L11 methyltransferase
MKNNWIEFCINTTTIIGELLSDFFQNEGAKGVVLGEWNKDISEYTTVKAYFLEDEKNINDILDSINDKLRLYSEYGLNIGSGEVYYNIVKEEDWENNWKRFFTTFKLGKNIVIKPLWDNYSKKENEIIINFDPGMAFGTGTHPSTKLCIEELEILSEKLENKNINVLDLGTGSGILSIELALLGFKNITAIDNDIVSYRAAKENFNINKINPELIYGTILDTNKSFDIIVANLLAEIIEDLSYEISKKLNKNGVFIGAGIIRKKEKDVIHKLESNYLKYIESKYIDDWVLVKFLKDR